MDGMLPIDDPYASSGYGRVVFSPVAGLSDHLVDYPLLLSAGDYTLVFWAGKWDSRRCFDAVFRIGKWRCVRLLAQDEYSLSTRIPILSY